MTFAEWKKNSALFCDVIGRLKHQDELSRVCQAAYKAGQRDGIKQTPNASPDTRSELITGIEKCYEMLISERFPSVACNKAEIMLRNLLYSARRNVK